MILKTNESYRVFIAILTSIYDKFFLKSWIAARHSKNTTSWITRGIARVPNHK